jgi:S1-C subfamily serine protease
MKSIFRFGATALVAALLVTGGSGSSAAQSNGTQPLAGVDLTTLRNATVHISTVGPLTPQGRPAGAGSGSGYVIDNQQCLVVTNHHVINGAAFIRVTTAIDTQNALRATVVGQPNPQSRDDVAILRLESCAGLPQVRFGDSAAVRPGDGVIAIGGPLGLSDTVTYGVVSNPQRFGAGGAVAGYIQHDTAVNPGNSGGPLFNLRGEVVGTNTAIMSRTGNFAGISLTVPSNSVRRAAEGIIANGRPSWPQIGAMVGDLNATEARVLGVPADVIARRTYGANIREVMPNSPAARGGLQMRDIVYAVNGTDIRSSAQFVATLNTFRAGETVTFSIVRNKQPTTVSVTLGDGFRAPEANPALAPAEYTGILGMDLETRPGVPGPVVTKVYNMGPAHEAGLIGPAGADRFMAIVGVVAEGPEFPHQQVRTSADLQRYIARAMAMNRKIILEVAIVGAAAESDEEENAPNARPRRPQAPQAGAEPVFMMLEFAPRAFRAN